MRVIIISFLFLLFVTIFNVITLLEKKNKRFRNENAIKHSLCLQKDFLVSVLIYKKKLLVNF